MRWVLAKLDPKDYQAKMNEANAKYISAKADLDRYRLLYEEESATKQELDQAQANFDVAQAQYDFASQELSYTILKAPRSGQVVSKDAEVNENVAAGQVVCPKRPETIGTFRGCHHLPDRPAAHRPVQALFRPYPTLPVKLYLATSREGVKPALYIFFQTSYRCGVKRRVSLRSTATRLSRQNSK